MADSLNSSSDDSRTVCDVFDSYPYVTVAAVSAGSAILSALCCIFVIVIIVVLKKHHSFIQRMIVYHSLAALFRSLSTMLHFYRLAYQSEDSAIDTLCAVLAFTNQVSVWCLIMDYSILTFTLLMTVVFQRNVARLELLYLVLIFAFPFTFNWIPFIDGAYGRYAAWCWIRDLNFDDCSRYEFGIILQNVLLNIPLYIFTVVMTPMYVTVIIYIARNKYRTKGKESHDQEPSMRHFDEEVWPLLFFPFGVLLLNIFPLVNSVYESMRPDDPSYVLWMLTAIFTPLQGGYIALVYTLDRGTLRRLTYSRLKAALLKWKEADIREYPIEAVDLSDSVGDAGTSYISFHDYQKYP